MGTQQTKAEDDKDISALQRSTGTAGSCDLEHGAQVILQPPLLPGHSQLGLCGKTLITFQEGKANCSGLIFKDQFGLP